MVPRLLALFAVAACIACTAHAQLTTLYAFNGTDGAWARGSLTISADGSTLYGRTSLGGTANTGTIFSIGTNGSSFNSLYSFTADPTDGLGMMPHHNAMILVGSTLYGAALYGGNENNPQSPGSPDTPPPPVFPKNGNGTLFSIGTDGSNYTAIHAFNGWADAAPTGDNALPHSTFFLNGTTAYGMTSNGGANNHGALYTFDLTNPAGTYQVLYSFSQPTGDEPHGLLTLDSTGQYLLGMTRLGGTDNLGVIFRYDLNAPGGDYDVLYDFLGGNDSGATNAHGFLTRIGTTLYGTTEKGGDQNAGVVFSINEDGSNFTLLHEFGAGTDGTLPYGSLTLVNGLLYGTTTHGGLNDAGIIFSLDPGNLNYAQLASFDIATTGAYPEDFLTASLDGTMLYGQTQAGGANDPLAQNYYGTVFALAIPEPSPIACLALALLLFAAIRLRTTART